MRKINDNSLRMLEKLSGAINSGPRPCGSALPQENELCNRYNISRPTVRRVLDKVFNCEMIIRY